MTSLDVKEMFYEDLQATISAVPKADKFIVLGDFVVTSLALLYSYYVDHYWVTDRRLLNQELTYLLCLHCWCYARGRCAR